MSLRNFLTRCGAAFHRQSQQVSDCRCPLSTRVQTKYCIKTRGALLSNAHSGPVTNRVVPGSDERTDSRKAAFLRNGITRVETDPKAPLPAMWANQQRVFEAAITGGRFERLHPGHQLALDLFDSLISWSRFSGRHRTHGCFLRQSLRIFSGRRSSPRTGRSSILGSLRPWLLEIRVVDDRATGL
jgi:hypothetical protein